MAEFDFIAFGASSVGCVLAPVAVSHDLFGEILRRIDDSRPSPDPA